MIMEKKIFFFDIDGTIYHEQKITDRVIQAIHDIQKQGHYCFIASGRPYTFIPQVLKDVGFDGFILANGAYVFINDHIISHEVLDYRDLNRLLQYLRDTHNEYILQTKDTCYLKKEYTKIYNFFKSIGMRVHEFIEDFDEDEIMKDVIKVEVWPNSREEGEEIKKNLVNFSWHQYENLNMELYSNKVSKASGVDKIIKLLNINLKNTYAFGDGRNDFEMFDMVEHSYAMANAPLEVQERAKYVCPSVTEDGVAVILEEIFKCND